MSTYADVAAAIGSSPRAVGQALKRNPFAPEVPCHRVVRADGSIGGFQGRTDEDTVCKKLELLRQEGVRFKGHRLESNEQIFKFQHAEAPRSDASGVDTKT